MTPAPSSRAEQKQMLARHIGLPEEIVEKTVIERFAAIVSCFPDTEAVRSVNEDAYTYKELDAASNKAANAILTAAGPGAQPVVLIAGMGISAIAGIIGILKAGKFYVPLDPSLPMPQLRTQFAAINSAVVVTDNSQEKLARRLVNPTSYVVNLDRLDAAISTQSIACAVTPDDLVCVIYSSGSTGEPKGVMQNQRNIMRMIFAPSGPGRWRNLRVAQHAFFIHTGSLFEIFGSLLSGSTLYPYDICSGGFDELANRLKTLRINYCGFTPAVFRMLCSTLGPGEKFEDMRRLVLGGDSISVSGSGSNL